MNTGGGVWNGLMEFWPMLFNVVRSTIEPTRLNGSVISPLKAPMLAIACGARETIQHIAGWDEKRTMTAEPVDYVWVDFPSTTISIQLVWYSALGPLIVNSAF